MMGLRSGDSLLEAYFSTVMRPLCPSSPAPHVAVALSGGADSMACTLLANAWVAAHGGTLTALTVDHGLRPESAHEAAQVAAWMRERGIAHQVLTPPPLPAIRNPQAQARARRYGALLDHCRSHAIPALLLAHHADDQAETVALQRHRGASPASRAGMAVVTPRGGVSLLRPLLGVRKRELMRYLAAQRVVWLEDPSNARDDYARNRLRRTLSEDEIRTLWQEAQTQGEARHAAEAARNDWMLAHTTLQAGSVQMDRHAWCSLAEEATRMDYLSHIVRHVGGKTYRPRLAESARLAKRVQQENAGTATLGHCLIRWQDAQCTVIPEPAHQAGLDGQTPAPHMMGANAAHNPLVKPPFWWFNMPHLLPLE